MRNKITDLNNHLFEQLERLNDDELTEDKLTQEIQRSKDLAGVAQQIIENTKNAIEVVKIANKSGANTSRYFEDSILKLNE